MNWLSIGMIVLVFGFFYFFMLRPQKKREKAEAEMRSAVQVGDEITTIGGIIGKIVSIKGETFVLETTKDKTKIRFLKGAIRSVDVRVADVANNILEAKEATENAPEQDSIIEPAPVAEEPAVESKRSRKRKAAKAKEAEAVNEAEILFDDQKPVSEPEAVADTQEPVTEPEAVADKQEDQKETN